MLCLSCGTVIGSSWPFEYHVSCFPDDMVVPGFNGMTGFDIGLKEDVIETVLWAYRNSARSLQTQLGSLRPGMNAIGGSATRWLGLRRHPSWVGIRGLPLWVRLSIRGWNRRMNRDRKSVV